MGVRPQISPAPIRRGACAGWWRFLSESLLRQQLFSEVGGGLAMRCISFLLMILAAAATNSVRGQQPEIREAVREGLRDAGLEAREPAREERRDARDTRRDERRD